VKALEAYVMVAGLVVQAEAIVELRERKGPADWAMTAFGRHRVVELLGLEPTASYGGELDADPVVLFEAAARVVDRLAVPAELRAWRAALADALAQVIADVRMVQGARDV
jgi:hypothetical protein